MKMELNSTEKRTLNKLEMNQRGSELLLQLFKKGYTDVLSVITLLKYHIPKYHDKEMQRKFRVEFWLGMVRSEEMLKDVETVVQAVVNKENEKIA